MWYESKLIENKRLDFIDDEKQSHAVYGENQTHWKGRERSHWCHWPPSSVSQSSTHTHPFNGPLSVIPWVGQYQKGKTNLDFTEARDSEWQWHQLGHMQVCTSLQIDYHASTSPLIFIGRMPFLSPNQQRQSTEGNSHNCSHNRAMLVFLAIWQHQSHASISWRAMVVGGISENTTLQATSERCQSAVEMTATADHIQRYVCDWVVHLLQSCRFVYKTSANSCWDV